MTDIEFKALSFNDQLKYHNIKTLTINNVKHLLYKDKLIIRPNGNSRDIIYKIKKEFGFDITAKVIL